MRIFIGIELPKEIKEELFNVQKKFDRKNSKIKWVSKNKLHLTLKFIGEVEKDKIDLIVERLNIINFDSFEVELGEIKHFERNGKIGVIYVSLRSDKEVVKLQQKIDAELLELFPSPQKFSSHLTLGRVKLVKKNKEFEKELTIIEVGHTRFKINGFSLISSKLTKDGPKYNVIKTFNE